MTHQTGDQDKGRAGDWGHPTPDGRLEGTDSSGPQQMAHDAEASEEAERTYDGSRRGADTSEAGQLGRDAGE